MLALNSPLGLAVIRKQPGWVIPGVSCDLDFLHSRYWSQGNSRLDNLLSTTRASTGYAQMASGLLVPFAANTPRITDQGLLVEEARTNLALQSQTFDNAAWTVGGSAVITANSTVAPDGTTTGDTYTEASSTSVVRNTTAITVVNGSTYNVSLIVQRSNFDWVRLVAGDSTGLTNSVRAWFNIATGTVGTVGTSGAGWTGSNGKIEALANGWYRISFNVVPGATSLFFVVSSAAADNTSTRADVGGGAGVGTIAKIWASQVELGAFATSYIPTTTANVTRAADVISLTGAAATAALAAKAARFETNLVALPSGTARLFVLGNNTITLQSSSTLRVGDGTNTVDGTLGSGATTGLTKSAFGLDNTSMTVVANGGAKGTQSTSVWATNAVGQTPYLGNRSAGDRALNGYMRRATFGPTKGMFDGMTA